MPTTKSDFRRGAKAQRKSCSYIFNGILTYASIMVAIFFYPRASKYFTRTRSSQIDEPAPLVEYIDPPKYWGVCLNNWNPFGNLRTVNNVFDYLGYANASNGDDWDVLWSNENPFDPTTPILYNKVTKPLKTHQRINHFPGNEYLTVKSMCTRSRKTKNILHGFVFPQHIAEFNEYTKANPTARFVEISKDNRGVKLVNKGDIKFDDSGKFLQVFMEKPFMIDNHAVDFSVYALISSIDPIRIYRYNGEVHLRFRSADFDSRKLFYEMPSLKKYYDDFGISFKMSLEHYFGEKRLNVAELWRKIDESIVELVLQNEGSLVQEVYLFTCILLFHLIC